MKRFAYILLVLTLASSATACGTINSLANDADNKIYGGIRVDWQKMKKVDDDETVHTGFLRMLDLPLSLVADTIMLPYTMFKALMAAPDK